MEQTRGNPQFILFQKLKILKRNLKEWNRVSFGNLKLKIAAAEEKVLQAQLQLDSYTSTQAHIVLQVAKSELHNLLQAEETHWKQKARIKWLEEGDRNTKFFHISAKIRGATNKISKISYNGQEWSEQSTLKSAAVEFFSSTFRNLVNQIDQEIFKVNLPTVSEQQNSDLLTIPSAEEIKDIVFGLKRSSAPGPDGFSSSFFTHCWSIVRDTVITEVNFFFHLW